MHTGCMCVIVTRVYGILQSERAARNHLRSQWKQRYDGGAPGVAWIGGRRVIFPGPGPRLLERTRSLADVSKETSLSKYRGKV